MTCPPAGAPLTCSAGSILPGAAGAAGGLCGADTHPWLRLSWCPVGSQGPSPQSCFPAGGPTYAGTFPTWEPGSLSCGNTLGTWPGCGPVLTLPPSPMSGPWCPRGTLLRVAGASRNPHPTALMLHTRGLLALPQTSGPLGSSFTSLYQGEPRRGWKGKEGSQIATMIPPVQLMLPEPALPRTMLCPAGVLHTGWSQGRGETVCGALCARECCRAAGGWQIGFGSGVLSQLIRISLTAWTEANGTDSAESTLQL